MYFVYMQLDRHIIDFSYQILPHYVDKNDYLINVATPNIQWQWDLDGHVNTINEDQPYLDQPAKKRGNLPSFLFSRYHSFTWTSQVSVSPWLSAMSPVL